MSDAAFVLLSSPARDVNGRFFIDDEVLLGAGKSVVLDDDIIILGEREQYEEGEENIID